MEIGDNHHEMLHITSHHITSHHITSHHIHYFTSPAPSHHIQLLFHYFTCSITPTLCLPCSPELMTYTAATVAAVTSLGS